MKVHLGSVLQQQNAREISWGVEHTEVCTSKQEYILFSRCEIKIFFKTFSKIVDKGFNNVE